MGALFEYKGVVEKVNELQHFESGFEKREIVLTDDIGTVVNYPNILCFVFKKERVKLVEAIQPGMRVKIVFAIDGREWKDNYGKVRYFTDLTGLKLEVLSAANSTSAENVTMIAVPPAVSEDSVSDDMPF